MSNQSCLAHRAWRALKIICLQRANAALAHNGFNHDGSNISPAISQCVDRAQIIRGHMHKPLKQWPKPLPDFLVTRC